MRHYEDEVWFSFKGDDYLLAPIEFLDVVGLFKCVYEKVDSNANHIQISIDEFDRLDEEGEVELFTSYVMVTYAYVNDDSAESQIEYFKNLLNKLETNEHGLRTLLNKRNNYSSINC